VLEHVALFRVEGLPLLLSEGEPALDLFDLRAKEGGALPVLRVAVGDDVIEVAGARVEERPRPLVQGVRLGLGTALVAHRSAPTIPTTLAIVPSVDAKSLPPPLLAPAAPAAGADGCADDTTTCTGDPVDAEQPEQLGITTTIGGYAMIGGYATSGAAGG